MMFYAILSYAFGDDDYGSIPIRYRCDGKLLNLRRLKATANVTETASREFLYADDCALNACLEGTVRHQMNKFSVACAGHFGLNVSNKKQGRIQPVTLVGAISVICGCQVS